MEMTKIKCDESMMERCLAKLRNPDEAVLVPFVLEIDERPVPRVKYWDEFRNAIDKTSYK